MAAHQNDVWRSLYHFWLKIFAVNFGMGVVSGLVMAYQFGTNWSGFSQFAGSITGPLLTYEVLTAFFGSWLSWRNDVRLEQGRPWAALLFNLHGGARHADVDLLDPRLKQLDAHPQGFTIENGQVIPQDWLAIIFNPSFPYRLIHMAIAAFLSSALFVGASGAWHLLRGNDTPAIRTMFSMAMWMALLVPHSGRRGRYARPEHA